MDLIQPLFDGPVDIVGDVHGEHDALLRLLTHLGYEPDGAHPEGRRLVFVGDLVDRGHDSPAVLELVMDLVAKGRAQVTVGNHELNILVGIYGHGNGWLMDPPPGVEPERFDSVTADPARRGAYLEFLAGLPIALERPDLRVVHACWHHHSIETLRAQDPGPPLAERFSRYETDTASTLDADPVLSAALDWERTRFDPATTDSTTEPIPLPGHTRVELAVQHGNPLRALTTSLVRATPLPYHAAGRWRMAERIPWWNTYADPVPVVIGHFWRSFATADTARYGVFGQDVLAGVAPHDWMGLARNVYCVDYSVGKRHLARSGPGSTIGGDTNDGHLAAVRVPEWELFHDDGAIITIGPPGLADHS